ncbi:vWA domain-containing protein [Actinomadura sp. WMMA1423]|uniref:vWA domain-containing protein n=1 Tax=Actinomadura sp. WMMA1423 TaxID=2591108 RepID=UPI00114702E0|nr:vWA domain-containing protein [Actinomadura sp. WMMA1423]
MSESGNGNSDALLDRLVRAAIPGLLFGVLSGLIVKLINAVSWLETLTLALLVLAIAAGSVAVSVALFRSRRAGAALKRVFGILPWNAEAVAWTFAGAAVMAAVLLAETGVVALAKGAQPCGRPLELRVVTTPEALPALGDAARGFEAGSEERGCRAYSVTVTPEPEFVQLSEAFGRLWRRSEPPSGEAAPAPADERLYGPQPDVWVPSSRAEFAYVEKSPAQIRKVKGTGAANPGPPDKVDPVFTPWGSLGSSPLVLAVFGDHGVRYSAFKPPERSTAALLERFGEAGVRLRNIARPVPETSAAAVAVTPVLYRALPGSEGQDEQFASPAALVAPDAVTLLCKARQGSRPPDGIAFAVPEQVVSDYDNGRLEDRCGAAGAPAAGGEWMLYPYYAGDLPTLDYPFIQVTWRGQDTRERDLAVARFHRWLVDHPLTRQGFRDQQGLIPSAHEGDSARPDLVALRRKAGTNIVPNQLAPVAANGGGRDVAADLERVAGARPPVSVALMLDVSGSMSRPAEGRDTRLARGVSFLQSLVAQLQSHDSAGLQVASEKKSPVGPYTLENVRLTGADPRQKNRIASHLQAAATTGSDIALGDMIGQAGLGQGTKNLIVVTDGQSGGSADAGSIGKAAARFRDRHRDVRVTVMLTGPTGCDASPVKEVVSAFRPAGGAGCVALTRTPEPQQAAQLLSELR